MWGKILFLDEILLEVFHFSNEDSAWFLHLVEIFNSKNLYKNKRGSCNTFFYMSESLQCAFVQWKRMKKVIPITAHQLWYPVKRWPLDFLKNVKTSLGNSCSERETKVNNGRVIQTSKSFSVFFFSLTGNSFQLKIPTFQMKFRAFINK